MARVLRKTAILAAIALAATALTLALGEVRFFQLLELKARDAHFVLRGKQAVDNIVILAIDDKAANHFPDPYLFWHRYYADAIRGAASGGAKVLVLDVAFGIPVARWEPENDAALAAAVNESNTRMPVVAAFVANSADQSNPAFAVPLNMMAAAFGLNAMANLTDDADNFVRRQELIEAPKPGSQPEALTRSMSLRAVEKLTGQSATIQDGRVFLGPKEIPTDGNRNMIINYAGPADTFPRVSLYDFVSAARSGDAAQLSRWVKDKVVLIGPDNLDDRHATPFFTAFSLTDKWMTPGVEIHANSIRTMLTGDYLRESPAAARIASLLAVTALTVALAATLPVAQTVLASLLIVLAVLAGTHLFFLAGWLLATSELTLGFATSLVGAIVYRFATAERKSSFFRGAVALFVGKQVARTLEQSGEIALSGKRQVVTILFTDIRGFTAFCESKDPAVVVDLLNAYMQRMVAIIVAHHGHVNKFIGDGILAVFSDDDETAKAGDHARRALACATEMVTAQSDFKTGAGLHSGEVVIGNVGSSDKMEFTVLGDTVNLASRLESLNKEHKTRLLFSEETREMAGQGFDTKYLGEVPVRGKTVPMKLYTIASLILTALLAALGLQAQTTQNKEEPVGLLLTPGTAKVVRAGTETALAARPGDILFSGDAVRTSDSAATFLYCPAKASQTLNAASEVLLDAKQLKIKTGKLSPATPVNTCFLPQVVRVAVASQQHYGVSMTRGLARPEGDPVSFGNLPEAVKTEIAPLEDVLRADPSNAAALVEEAAAYDRANLESNALAAYRKVAALWPDAAWARGRIFEIEESLADKAALKAAEAAPDAKTFALLIGISKYEKLPDNLWLQFPEADAKTFAQHLASPRGGNVPADQMVVLTNEQATTAAIRNGFQAFLKSRAGAKDTIFVLIAAQGTLDSRGAFIVTYDSDPQDLSSTALPVAELQTLIEQDLSKVGRVVFLADVSRSSAIGNLKTAGVNTAIERLGQAKGEMLGLTASRPKELSLEGTQFGGGHGAFTYSLLKGLNGLADHDDNRAVSAGELIDFVRDNVAGITANKQHPRDFGSMANATKLSDLSQPGITLARFRTLFDSRSGEPFYLAGPDPQAAVTAQSAADVDAFHNAIAAQRILPGAQGSAWDILDRLRGELPPQRVFLEENNLRVALEDRAQQVLLRYLAGDQSPQTKAEFDNGSLYMEAALRLTPESLYLAARRSFFNGRALLFDKQYANAASLLEQAVRTDPGEAYGYNALGIAYLEQGDFAKAIPAFRDAARRAPNWSYPLHNLAVASVESGDNQTAIRSYQQAMKLTPQFSYLPYNLGLVYQRMNRRREAEDAYRKAMAIEPESAEPLNALGSLKASEGKVAEAEKFYRQALEKRSTLLAARHNLGSLLAEIKGRQAEAIDAWKQNLAIDPDYIASRLALADLLASTGDTTGAIEQYSLIVAAKPDYTGARLALAAAYLKASRPADAVEQLRAAAKLDANSPALWEQLGDAERSLGHADESKQAYSTALKLQSDKSARKRVSGKLAF